MGEHVNDINSVVKNLFDKFYDLLATIIKPLSIIHRIDGISPSDIKKITDATGNGNDRQGTELLLQILRRSSSDTLIAFLQYLQDRPDANEINEYIKRNHRSIFDCVTERQRPALVVAVQPRRSPNPDPRTPAIINSRIARNITKDLIIGNVPNAVLKKWAAMLNLNKRWEELADELWLTRFQVRKLEECENPGLKILDTMIDMETYTVQDLLIFLASAQLFNVHQEVINCLANPTEYCTNATTRAQTSAENCRQNQHGDDSRSELNVRQMNPSPEQTNQQTEIPTPIQHGVNRSYPQETEVQTETSAPTRNTVNTGFPQETAVQILQQNAEISTSTEQHSPHNPVQSVIRQPETSDDTYFEKNAQQEADALDRAVNDQFNLNSYRDIQNSVPGTSPSGEAMAPLVQDTSLRLQSNDEGETKPKK